MIVYGDRAERVGTSQAFEDAALRIARIRGMPAGLERHSALCAVLIRLGQIAQAVGDLAFEATGADGGSAGEAALLAALTQLGGALLASWDSGFQLLADLPDIAAPDGLPDELELRVPEGFAYYAVYPEAYLLAARALGGGEPVTVIGIRSIGTSLAAIVSAAVGAPPPFCVRPVGHPFERRISVDAAAAARLIDAGRRYLIVDEGPGLSGSSFAAVADFLMENGVKAERIAFLPSHGGRPGSQATAATRGIWAQVRQSTAHSEALVDAERLAGWAEPLIGPLDKPLEEVSGGGWRARRYPCEADWPAINPNREQRKFLASAGGERWLLKFAGLGKEGERKLERGRVLTAAGLVPEVRGLLHGFLVERWIEGAQQPERAALLPAAARYLGRRAALLTQAGSGASLGELRDMAAYNIASALGADAAVRFAAAFPLGEAEREASRPMAVDGRCAPHEWLQAPDGPTLKADALDHDAAHDLVGAQDLAWDAAGLIAEFDLDAAEREHFLAFLDAAAPRPTSRVLLRFLTPCYLAFRLGGSVMAQASLAGWPEEAERNREAATRLGEQLLALLRGDAAMRHAP